MLIASKYEEIWAPELNDFVYISDRAYKKEQILTMEKVMLNALKFNLTGVCVQPRPAAAAFPRCTAAMFSVQSSNMCAACLSSSCVSIFEFSSWVVHALRLLTAFGVICQPCKVRNPSKLFLLACMTYAC
jgi:Cyclin, N-terminal domain